jgi:hypothetical protein
MGGSESKDKGNSSTKFKKEDEYFEMVKRRRMKDQMRHDEESGQRGKAYQ